MHEVSAPLHERRSPCIGALTLPKSAGSCPWVSFWDLSYADGSYLEHWDPPEIPKELVQLVESGEIPRASAVLDVGCGAGREALFMAEQGYRVTGLDSSREALRQARLNQKRLGIADTLAIDWILGSAFDPSVEPSSVDLVLDRGCLHCVDHEGRPRYAKAIERVLRPGGKLFLREAREDDEEQGLVGLTTPEVDRLFPPGRFHRGPLLPMTLNARAGGLPAVMVLVQKAGSRPASPRVA